MIAFTGEYDGNEDVYVVPAAGGIPKRLTTHPDPDQVAGWTRDGKSVLFRSTRGTYAARYAQLYTVALSGGLPKVLPLPMAFEGRTRRTAPIWHICRSRTSRNSGTSIEA